MLAENDQIKILTTIPGIGVYSAMIILAEIGELVRFTNPKKLSSYAGLVPSIYQSGETVRTGKITKQGSAWLRWILIQCIQKTINKPNAIGLFYQRLVNRKGEKWVNKARVACARKLLTYIYIMLNENIGFNELKVNRPRA